MGSIREKRPGFWELRVYVGQDPVEDDEQAESPKRRAKSVYRSRAFRGGERAAKKALAAFETELSAAGEKASAAASCGFCVRRWIDQQEQMKLSPTTIRTYRMYAKRWLEPMIGAKRAVDLKAGDVSALHAKMIGAGKSVSTVRQVHAILRGSLGLALQNEWIQRNVAAQVKPPKQLPSKFAAATLADIARLMDAAGEPGSDLWTCTALAVSLGARAGELCALRWSDVDLEARTVTIARSAYTDKGKTMEKGVKSDRMGEMSGGRTLSIDETTVAVLTARRAFQLERWERVCGGPHPTEMIDDPYVLSFWSDGSGPPVPSSYSHNFGDLRDALGLKHLHLHSLRHFMVSHLLDQGVPLAVASERAGHSSPAVTARIYTHAVAGRDVEAGEVMGGALQLSR